MLRSTRPAQLPPPDGEYCLFLDFDGTLVDLAPTPRDVVREAALITLLDATARCLSGAVAIVSGRQIDAVDALLAPLRMPVAGVHGFERRAADGMIYRPTPDASRHAALHAKLADFVALHPGLLLEDKAVALAVHFRAAPHLAAKVLEHIHGLKRIFGDSLEVLEGNAVVEIKPAIHSKATAVEAFMQEAPFAGRTPIYIGDDTSDCDGFVAVERYQGMAIAVGTRVLTPWCLRDPSAVRSWLADFNHQCVQSTEH